MSDCESGKDIPLSRSFQVTNWLHEFDSPRSSDILVSSHTLLRVHVSYWLDPRPVPSVTPKLVCPEGGSVGKSSFLTESRWNALAPIREGLATVKWLVLVYILWGISTDLEEVIMQSVGRQRRTRKEITEILRKLADGFVGVWNYLIKVSFQKPFIIRRAYQKMSKWAT